jgi:hypothetical protein
MENKNIIDAVNGFVAKNQTAIDEHYAKHYPNLTGASKTQLKLQTAQKYFKIWNWRYDRNESIHAFIDKTTGDIFMPAGLNKPAKHARGNVFSPLNGTEALAAGGSIRYLR